LHTHQVNKSIMWCWKLHKCPYKSLGEEKSTITHQILLKRSLIQPIKTQHVYSISTDSDRHKSKDSLKLFFFQFYYFILYSATCQPQRLTHSELLKFGWKI
jgi:hypothetical protein